MTILAEVYLISDEELLSIRRPEKAICAVTLNPPFQGNGFHVSHSSPFWQHENLIFKDY
jgi:hypothetical protein